MPPQTLLIKMHSLCVFSTYTQRNTVHKLQHNNKMTAASTPIPPNKRFLTSSGFGNCSETYAFRRLVSSLGIHVFDRPAFHVHITSDINDLFK